MKKEVQKITPYFKVKDLIKELKKMNQESLALFHFHAIIGEKVFCGYTPYNKLTTKKVILKNKKSNWYVESKSPNAQEIVVLDYE